MNVLGRNGAVFVHSTYSKVFNRTVAYKSAISLDNLYPNSTLALTTPTKPPVNDIEKFNGYIPIDELEITYCRSSGPGGQNVNKVNTKVDVRFHLLSAKWLSDEIKRKLAERLQSKLTKEGYLIFKSDLTRHQQLNLADCLEKIRSAVWNSIEEKQELSEETQEKIRRKIERAARERLALKRQKSQIKSDRQGSEVVL